MDQLKCVELKYPADVEIFLMVRTARHPSLLLLIEERSLPLIIWTLSLFPGLVYTAKQGATKDSIRLCGGICQHAHPSVHL